MKRLFIAGLFLLVAVALFLAFRGRQKPQQMAHPSESVDVDVEDDVAVVPDFPVLPSVAKGDRPLPGIAVGQVVYVSGRGALPSIEQASAREPTEYEVWRREEAEALASLTQNRKVYWERSAFIEREADRQAVTIREQGYLGPAAEVAAGLSRIRFALVSVDEPGLFPVFPEELALLGLVQGNASKSEIEPSLVAAAERCATYAAMADNVGRLGALCVAWAESAGGGKEPEEHLTPL
jgi:hypothetical protein